MSEPKYVLDASALLAAMLGETGADAVRAIMGRAKIGTVNLSEVIAKLRERGVPEEVVDESLAELDLHVVAFDRTQADIAGKLRVSTRSAGLSLGDRACLALAIASDAIAVTTDRAWSKLDAGLDVLLVR